MEQSALGDIYIYPGSGVLEDEMLRCGYEKRPQTIQLLESTCDICRPLQVMPTFEAGVRLPFCLCRLLPGPPLIRSSLSLAFLKSGAGK